jgi:hypothetical protein
MESPVLALGKNLRTVTAGMEGGMSPYQGGGCRSGTPCEILPGPF